MGATGRSQGGIILDKRRKEESIRRNHPHGNMRHY